ncbi:hypothetical protein [Burkholderia sp. WP9]|uniref:hypothetical protein n=1 Tax=Burkholderia sp. WP9 TaxID=1500263 RepID=UPI0015A6E80A|nr:hypothetical protein [Burkholderia sp. WP9]
MNVEIEDGGETRAGVQRRDGDAVSPVLHVVFSHAQPSRCARRTDVGAFEGPVKARGQGTPQAVVLDATLKVTDIRLMKLHLVTSLSIYFLGNLVPPLLRRQMKLRVRHDSVVTPRCHPRHLDHELAYWLYAQLSLHMLIGVK